MACTDSRRTALGLDSKVVWTRCSDFPTQKLIRSRRPSAGERKSPKVIVQRTKIAALATVGNVQHLYVCGWVGGGKGRQLVPYKKYTVQVRNH